METYRYKHYSIPVHRTVLPSGMTLMTAKKKSATVLVNLFFATGSLDDGDHPGAAHCIEHLLFEGPERNGIHPAFLHLYTKGASDGAGTNAFLTEYWMSGLQEDTKDLLDTLLSICFTETLDCSALSEERGVILQEIRQNMGRRIFEHWRRETLFPHVPAFHHTPAGTLESIAKIDANTLRAFHAKWYHPAHTMLVVAGNVEHQEILDMVLEHPSAAIPPREPIARRSTFAPTVARNVFQQINAPSVIHLYYGELPTDAEARRMIDCAFSILTENARGILSKALRHDRSIVYGVNHINESWPARYRGFAIPTKEEHFAEVEKICGEGIDRLIASDYPDELFERVRTMEIIGARTGRERGKGRWADILSYRWLTGDLEDRDELAIYQELTREDIARVARDYFTTYGVIHIVPKT